MKRPRKQAPARDPAAAYRALMRRLGYVRLGKKRFTRDEMNAR